MAGGFTYHSLSRSEREIRLLELFPSNHHLGKERPACRLFHTSLRHDPPYLAVSYVWGDASKKRVILVNKRPFRVTCNLYDAMMGLRETKSVIIWIDAICINQLDDDEKGWQVRLMDDLYRKAFGVLAWIGAPADNSDVVIDHLQTLGKQAEECGLHQTHEGCMKIWQEMASTPSYMDDPTTIVLLSWLNDQPLAVSKRALERLLYCIADSGSQYQLQLIADLNRLFRRPW
ncbi:heterokaryon incompatibility protein, partial [Ampelomyces quisqualis]